MEGVMFAFVQFFESKMTTYCKKHINVMYTMRKQTTKYIRLSHGKKKQMKKSASLK